MAAQEKGMTNSSAHLLPSDPPAKGAGGSKAAKAEGGSKGGAKGKGVKAAVKVQQQEQVGFLLLSRTRYHLNQRTQLAGVFTMCWSDVLRPYGI